SFRNSRCDESDSPSPSDASTWRSQVRNRTSPIPCRWGAGGGRATTALRAPLPLALGRDHHVHAPGRGQLLPVYLEPNRHRGVLADDARSLARDPDHGRPARIVRISPVLPFPAQTIGDRGIGPEDAAVQRLHGPAVFLSVAIDIGHGLIAAEAGVQARKRR